MKRINRNELIWFIILLCFLIYIGYLFLSGNMKYFIHPRMFKYMIFSLIGLIILTCFQFKKVMKVSHNEKIKIGYLLFLIPLMMGFIVNPKGLDSSISNTKGITMNDSNIANKNSSGTNTSKVFIKNGIVEFNDEDYVDIIEDIGSNTDKYNGKDIIIKGFIYKDKSFSSEQFVVARLLMVCCAADTQTIGILCRWNESNTLKKNEWVEIKGKINYTSYKSEGAEKSEILPIIKVQEVKKISKPAEEYIYP